MITLFGVALSVGEIMSLLGLFVALVAGFYKLNNKLSSIIERNETADNKMDTMERDLVNKITETKATLEARMVLAEGRIAGQEIRDARIDEKFNFMQGQLARLLNLVEKERER